MSGYTTVGPEGITGADVLELAEALIEQYGWAGSRPGTGALDFGDGSKPPYSIHHAIGEAASRVAQEQRTTKDNTEARKLRNAADRLLRERHGKEDIQLNDEAHTVEEVLLLMRQARGAA